MCEFYGMSDILMNPGLKTEKTKQMQELTEGEDVKVMRTNMQNFYETYKREYNDSQRKVLKRVCEMPDNDVLLIQGPVSYPPTVKPL